MSISSDLTQTLLASDGFSIFVKAAGKNLKRISYSILGLLDGIKQIEASGALAKLTHLSNAKYLVKVNGLAILKRSLIKKPLRNVL